MKPIFTFTFILIFNYCSSQIISNFNEVLHSDYLFLQTMEEDKEGNLFLAGAASSPFNLDFEDEVSFDEKADKDLFVVKYDKNRDYQWHLYLETNSQVIGTSRIQFDNAKNVYLFGYFSGYIDMTPDGLNRYTADKGLQQFIAKYDKDGNFISMYTYEHNLSNNVVQFEINNDQIKIVYRAKYSIDIDLSESELIINTFDNYIYLSRDVYVTYNLDFEILDYFKSTYRTHPKKVYFLDDGGFISGGHIDSHADLGINKEIPVMGNYSRSPYIAKYDKDKNLIWYYVLELDYYNSMQNYTVSNDGTVFYMTIYIEQAQLDNENIFKESVIFKIDSNDDSVKFKRISNLPGNKAYMVNDLDENVWLSVTNANLILDQDDEIDALALIVFDKEFKVVETDLVWANYLYTPKIIPNSYGGVTIANNGDEGNLYFGLDEEPEVNGELKIILQHLSLSTISSNINHHDNSIALFPTVSNDIINIKAEDSSRIESISIRSLSGDFITRQSVKSSFYTLNIELLNVGVYFASITNDTGEVINYKFMKI